jgi:hypothetical protein
MYGNLSVYCPLMPLQVFAECRTDGHLVSTVLPSNYDGTALTCYDKF